MSFKDVIRKLIPAPIRRARINRYIKRSDKKFKEHVIVHCNPTNLMSAHNVELKEIFSNREILESWENWQGTLESIQFPELKGGVNPGDRKAIFFLIRHFRPKSVLEIGTHIGASTVNIASALKCNQAETGTHSHLRTLDIRDVNSIKNKPWLKFGAQMSPLEMIKKFDFDSFVDFNTGSSLEYFENTEDTYDFIFLDGDHTAKTVYPEIPKALLRLNKGGVILLHDYFPFGKPLWTDETIIKGPYLATERLIKEGAEIQILPLGDLPWETKLNSKATSLALLLKK